MRVTQLRKKVSACMVLYRPTADALKTAACVAASTVPVHLYVVDNTPHSYVSGQLKALYPDAEIIHSPRNVGYGSANNLVLPRLNSTYHLILNPDVSFAPQLVEQMVRYMDAHPDIAVLTPRLENPDGTEQAVPRLQPHFADLVASVLQPYSSKADRRRRQYTLTDTPVERPMSVTCASGCFLLIRTHVFYRINGFDPRFFLYMEDCDLSLRAARLGQVVYHPGFTVTHGWTRGDRHSARLTWAHLVSAVRFFFKWGW